jgi:hypothetical protein
MEKREIAEIYK